MVMTAAAGRDRRPRRYRVEIVDAAGNVAVDTAWDSVEGGDLVVEFLACPDPASKEFQTTSPGHKSVNTVVLRGAMTNKRAALCQWINDTLAAAHAGDRAKGDAARYQRTVRIAEESV